MSEKQTQAYKVLKIDELTRIGENGGVERYYRHRIRTRGGTILSVDIGEADFNLDKASPILLEKATEADKVLNSGA